MASRSAWLLGERSPRPMLRNFTGQLEKVPNCRARGFRSALEVSTPCALNITERLPASSTTRSSTRSHWS